MLFFAYDGTINGDWVSHYAVRLASHHPQRQLRLVHVHERSGDSADRDRRIEQISKECAHLSVRLEVDIRNLTRNVFSTLRSAIPDDPDTFLVCGTRIRGRYRGYLAGSVGEQFLEARRFNVLVVRVVQPGLLGVPRTVLAPVSGHSGGFASGLPFLNLLAPDMARLHVLHVKRIGYWQLRRLLPNAADGLRRDGIEYCQRIEQEAVAAGALRNVLMDAHATVSDDVPKEIVVYANRFKSGLIYMGASERNWLQRLLLGNPLERVIRTAPCDVAVYRGVV